MSEAIKDEVVAKIGAALKVKFNKSTTGDNYYVNSNKTIYMIRFFDTQVSIVALPDNNLKNPYWQLRAEFSDYLIDAILAAELLRG